MYCSTRAMLLTIHSAVHSFSFKQSYMLTEMLDMQAVLTQSGKGVSATGMQTWFGSNTHDALHTRWGTWSAPTVTQAFISILKSYLLNQSDFQLENSLYSPNGHQVTWTALKVATKRCKPCVTADSCTTLSSITIHCCSMMC